VNACGFEYVAKGMIWLVSPDKTLGWKFLQNVITSEGVARWPAGRTDAPAYSTTSVRRPRALLDVSYRKQVFDAGARAYLDIFPDECIDITQSFRSTSFKRRIRAPRASLWARFSQISVRNAKGAVTPPPPPVTLM